MTLSTHLCEPCSGNAAPLTPAQVAEHLAQVNGWRLAGSVAIVKEWKFKNFVDSLAFVSKVGELAEAEQHHPDISLGWGYAKLLLTTHSIDGLSKNDFIMAAKIDEIA